MWIFGYGSLMWRVGFAYDDRRPCYVRGYRRRFWQGSSDHRGVPGAPGRVVTLLSSPRDHCWGMAYQVAPSAKEQVLAQLDHREKGGYERLREPLFTRDANDPFAIGITYVATPDNAEYLGCAPLPAIADQVVASQGPSGPNTEYVLELAEALRSISADDGHVFRLEQLVRERLKAPR